MLKDLVKGLGCPIIQSFGESDHVLGKVSNLDSYIASNDSDIFIYGEANLVLNLNSKDQDFFLITQ